jgi:hypothetical protein
MPEAIEVDTWALVVSSEEQKGLPPLPKSQRPNPEEGKLSLPVPGKVSIQGFFPKHPNPKVPPNVVRTSSVIVSFNPETGLFANPYGRQFRLRDMSSEYVRFLEKAGHPATLEAVVRLFQLAAAQKQCMVSTAPDGAGTGDIVTLASRKPGDTLPWTANQPTEESDFVLSDEGLQPLKPPPARASGATAASGPAVRPTRLVCPPPRDANGLLIFGGSPSTPPRSRPKSPPRAVLSGEGDVNAAARLAEDIASPVGNKPTKPARSATPAASEPVVDSQTALATPGAKSTPTTKISGWSRFLPWNWGKSEGKPAKPKSPPKVKVVAPPSQNVPASTTNPPPSTSAKKRGFGRLHKPK